MINLSLDESGLVEVTEQNTRVNFLLKLRQKWERSRFATDFEGNTTLGRLGVIDGLGTSLNVGVDSVVVRGGEGVEVIDAVNGDSVFGCVVANGGGVAGDLASGNVVGGLSTEEESVTAENGVSGEGRALESPKNKRTIKRTRSSWKTHLEQVKHGTSVEAALLVDSSDDTALVVLLRVKAGVQVELEALGDLVLELDDGAEDVGGGPSLGEGESVLPVGVLGLDVSEDGLGLGVLGTGDLEGDARGGVGLDLEGLAGEVVVLSEQVVGGLAEVLKRAKKRRRQQAVLST